MPNMKPSFLALGLSIMISGANTITQAGMTEDNILKIINSYRPGSTGYGEMAVKKVTIDKNRKTVTIDCNEATTYLPLTSDRMASLKADILKSLGTAYINYNVKLTASGKNLDDLVLFAPKRLTGPTETDPFITKIDGTAAPDGLEGANIALWQSHGWYFEPKLNRWEWQRARIFQTVEDLYTQSYVMPFLMPMLENAGAYVMSPRERDTQLTEIIVDNDNAATTGYQETNGQRKWKDSGISGFGWDGDVLKESQNPFKGGYVRIVDTTDKADKASTAEWNASIPENGNYAVYISYASLPHSATDAHYTIHADNGDHTVIVNQQMGGGTWIYLGHFPLRAGNDKPIVTLTNESSKEGSVVTADAVKIGGGLGNVARIVKEPLDDIDYEYVTSGYPRFVEGARYFLQWAGAPDSVYTPTDNVNDYTDDYRSRGLWVNWLAGGSSQLPGQEGLGIPVDLSFAFHSDAGTFDHDSIVGSLGIYCTTGDTLGNGSSRAASRDFTDLVLTNIVRDVRSTYEPRWTRRGMWDKSYFEARVPEVPAMLLELLSHQNFADMKMGLDPGFRFVVSRAVYKGMLQFLAHRDGRKYVVQPLPVKNFAIAATHDRKYRLSWEETVDSLEATAKPTYYIIEHRRKNGLGFEKIAESRVPEYEVTITDTDIHSYRIIAANEGGVSFPSEVLALCDLQNGAEPVMIVNGFTRVSGPDWFEAGEIAGFYDERDHGVPYVEDISFIGSQFEYRRNIPWMDDDAAGFGASRSDYEDKVVAGNTFDYVAIHGAAIKAAGHSFVSSSVGAYMQSPAEGQPRIVDLILGKQKEVKIGWGTYGTRFKAFPSQLQDKMAAAAKLGTSYFVSGSFVATDMWDNPYSSAEMAEKDQKFAQEVLGYHWRVGQASVTGEVYEVPSRFRDFTGGEFAFTPQPNSDCYAVESPDSFYAADPKTGCTIMRYSENNLVAGTASKFDTHKAVVIGFPFETIHGDFTRAELMKQTLNFLTNK